MTIATPTLLGAPAINSTTDGTSYVSGSLNPAASTWYVVGIQVSKTASVVGTPTLTSAFAMSVAWQQLGTIPQGGNTRRLSLWIGKTSGTPGTGAITVDLAGVTHVGCIAIMVALPAGMFTTSSTVADVVRSANLVTAVTAGAGSLTLDFGAVGYANAVNGSLAFFQVAGGGAVTPDTDPDTVELDEQSYATPSITVECQFNPTNENAVNASWSGSPAAIAIGIELVGLAPVVGGDTGGGTEAGTAPSATLPGADTGSDAEAQQLALSIADTGVGADAGAQQATLDDKEESAGTDTGALQLAGTDTGASAEVGAVSALVPGADTGSDTEAAALGLLIADTGSGTEAGATTAALADADTGAGAEAEDVVPQGPVEVDGADTGAGADAGVVLATLASSDAPAAADLGDVSATSAAADTGVGADTGSAGAALAGSDTSAGTEAEQLLAAWADADTAAGADVAALVAMLASADTSTGVDTGALLAMVAAADTGAGTEGHVLGVTAGDVGLGGDTSLQLLALLADTEQGLAVEVGVIVASGGAELCWTGQVAPGRWVAVLAARAWDAGLAGARWQAQLEECASC